MACSTALLAPPMTAWLLAVDVGDHHVAVDRLQDSLDFLERRKDRRHPAVVVHRHARHFTAAGADGFQRVLEGKGAGGNQRAVFAQAVSHRHVGLDAVSGQEPGQRHDRWPARRAA